MLTQDIQNYFYLLEPLKKSTNNLVNQVLYITGSIKQEYLFINRQNLKVTLSVFCYSFFSLPNLYLALTFKSMQSIVKKQTKNPSQKPVSWHWQKSHYGSPWTFSYFFKQEEGVKLSLYKKSYTTIQSNLAELSFKIRK